MFKTNAKFSRSRKFETIPKTNLSTYFLVISCKSTKGGEGGRERERSNLYFSGEIVKLKLKDE